MGECLNYLFDGSNNKRALAGLFRRVHEALRPGGLFIFDVAGPERDVDGTTHRRRDKDWFITHKVTKDRARRILTREITAFRKVGKLYRRSEETHRLRLYEPAEMAELLRRAGFRVRIVRGYGNFRFMRGHAGLIARKP